MAVGKRRRTRTQSGAVVVEFALVVPFLAMLLIGLVTTGMTYSDHLAVSNAVREGARFGASAPYTQASPNPVILPSDWATSVKNRVHDVYFNAGSNVAASEVCVQLVTSTGTILTPAVPAACGTAPTSPTGMATGSCAVKVWLQRSETIDLVIAPSLHFDIGAESVSYYGRTAGSCSAS